MTSVIDILMGLSAISMILGIVGSLANIIGDSIADKIGDPRRVQAAGLVVHTTIRLKKNIGKFSLRHSKMNSVAPESTVTHYSEFSDNSNSNGDVNEIIHTSGVNKESSKNIEIVVMQNVPDGGRTISENQSDEENPISKLPTTPKGMVPGKVSTTDKTSTVPNNPLFSKQRTAIDIDFSEKELKAALLPPVYEYPSIKDQSSVNVQKPFSNPLIENVSNKQPLRRLAPLERLPEIPRIHNDDEII